MCLFPGDEHHRRRSLRSNTPQVPVELSDPGPTDGAGGQGSQRGVQPDPLGELASGSEGLSRPTCPGQWALRGDTEDTIPVPHREEAPRQARDHVGLVTHVLSFPHNLLAPSLPALLAAHLLRPHAAPAPGVTANESQQRLREAELWRERDAAVCVASDQ